MRLVKTVVKRTAHFWRFDGDEAVELVDHNGKALVNSRCAAPPRPKKPDICRAIGVHFALTGASRARYLERAKAHIHLTFM